MIPISLVLALAWVYPVQAKRLLIEVSKDAALDIPLIMLGFEGEDEMNEIIGRDLSSSGIFRLIAHKGPQDHADAFENPHMWPWKPYKGAVLMVGQCEKNAQKMKMTIRLYDVASGRLINTGVLFSDSTQSREAAHKVANAIYQLLVREPGYFEHKILYTARFRDNQNREKGQIAIADYDGHNARFLTPASENALYARYCESKDLLVYTIRKPNYELQIHLKNLKTGEKKVLPVRGVVCSPCFASDNNSIVFSASKDGKTLLYQWDFHTGSVTRISNQMGQSIIELAPHYNPQGDCVFVSNRKNNKAKLYIQPRGAGEAVLLSTRNGSYYGPMWSPNSKWIAFSRLSKGIYNIGVISSDGSIERMLVEDYVVGDPYWLNGRSVIFNAHGRLCNAKSRISALYIRDIGADVMRPLYKVQLPHEAAFPSVIKTFPH